MLCYLFFYASKIECFLQSLSLKNILQNCIETKSFESHCSGWLLALLFSSYRFSPPSPLPPPPRDSITAHPARAVVFHCCERMQIAIPVPGPSINSNRINSSAVIVFCASQKTLYTRAASRFAPAMNNIRFIRTVAHVVQRLVYSYGWWNLVWKLDRTGREFDITSAIDHFIGNYRQRFASAQRKKKRIE